MTVDYSIPGADLINAIDAAIARQKALEDLADAVYAALRDGTYHHLTAIAEHNRSIIRPREDRGRTECWPQDHVVLAPGEGVDVAWLVNFGPVTA